MLRLYTRFYRLHANLIDVNHQRQDTDYCSIYCGMPAGLEAFRVADRVLNEMEQRGEIKRE